MYKPPFHSQPASGLHAHLVQEIWRIRYCWRRTD